MIRFVVIGITDNPRPWFPPEVMEIIKSGRVFSGGKRHHEIVARLLPSDAQWIDITVPLSNVFEQYRELSSMFNVQCSMFNDQCSMFNVKKLRYSPS
jgi:precorrin-6Y C5,15-methyltransferase (decarboxylating)